MRWHSVCDAHGIVFPGVWLYVKQRHSVRIVCRQNEAPELLVHGPGHKRRSYQFQTFNELVAFHREIERRLERDGWQRDAAAAERRSGTDRRARRSGRERRLPQE